jgi:hypothetical protein
MSYELQRRTERLIGDFKSGELVVTHDPMNHGTSATFRDSVSEHTQAHTWIPNGTFVLFIKYTTGAYAKVLHGERVWEVHASYLQRK